MTTIVMRSIGAIAATFFLAVLFSIPAEASEHVRAHVNKNGKFVSSHNRSNANSTQRDNWSSTGNTNPYTGKRGHKSAKK